MTDISVKRGDNETLDLVVTDTDTGDPLDLTGVSLWLTVKVQVNDPDSLAVIQKTVGSGITITDAAAGEASVSISPADTAPFPSSWEGVYDVQLKSAGSVRTVVSGAFTITGDVTWATA
jgi:hypothetical protein